MLGLCALPSALSKPVQRRKILFSTEAIPDFNALPLQARLGLFFSFLPALCPFCLNFHQREARCFSAGKDGYFVSEGFSRQLPLATAQRSPRIREGFVFASRKSGLLSSITPASCGRKAGKLHFRHAGFLPAARPERVQQSPRRGRASSSRKGGKDLLKCIV